MDAATAIVISAGVMAVKTLSKNIIKNSKTKIIKIILNGLVLRISGVIRNKTKAITPNTPNINGT